MFWLIINLVLADDATSIMSKFCGAYFIVVLQQVEELFPLVFVLTIYKYGIKVFFYQFLPQHEVFLKKFTSKGNLIFRKDLLRTLHFTNNYQTWIMHLIYH